MVQTDNTLEALQQYYQTNEKEILDKYFTLLKFKSISTDPTFKNDVIECCKWLENEIKDLGFKTELWEGNGYPIIFAENLEAGPNKPTLLLYHHYDVQPVDPEELWKTPPFEPTLINGKVYARGAQDNKGQCAYCISALKAYLEIYKSFPVNIKICIEGEEEIGSAFLSSLLEEKKDRLKADHLAIVDTIIPAENKPAISLGIRGTLALEVELTGSNVDFHSGLHGGIVYNPIHALTEMLAKLRDENGEVQVPGFYDDLYQLTKEELAELDFEFDVSSYEETYETTANGGEQDFSAAESNTIRPTVEINGISGGYTGEGFKTVIPAKAHAKISARLVKGQDPERTSQQIADFLVANCPEGMKIDVIQHSAGGGAFLTSPKTKVAQASKDAISKVFNKDASFVLCGASIPIAVELSEASSAEVIGFGTGLDSDLIHAPNEHFSLDRFKKGFLTIASFIELLGKS
ncbi:MAG: dipeptidase [Chlamydiales bacterium]|nr:dipeptidase [Chlamydiales bacterium]